MKVHRHAGNVLSCGKGATGRPAKKAKSKEGATPCSKHAEAANPFGLWQCWRGLGAWKLVLRGLSRLLGSHGGKIRLSSGTSFHHAR